VWSSRCSRCSSGCGGPASEACNGLDDDGDGRVDEITWSWWYADEDGDGYGTPRDQLHECSQPSGYVANPTDCDDAAPDVHPAADETCDGRDEDCSGVVDDDPVDGIWTYEDGDGDGFGRETGGVRECAASTGRVENDGDCDDGDPGRFPGADEWCDGTDDDSDALVDEEPVDGLTAYPDDDGDGWGRTEDGLQVCELAPGQSELPGDCDDSRPEVAPDADETCNLLDDDCDGKIDSDDPSCWQIHYLDTDGDGDGDPERWRFDCCPPPGYVETGGDCEPTDPSISSLAVEIWYDGVDQDCDGNDDDYDGDGVGIADDCDDMAADVYPGAPEVCGDTIDQDCDGSLWVSDEDPASASALLTGESEDDQTGALVLAAGDVDGDGLGDLWVSAPYRDGSSRNQGAVYLVLGPLSGSASLADAAAAVITGPSSGRYFGSSLAAGPDLDGDGAPDLVASGEALDDEGDNVLVVFVLTAPFAAEVSTDDARATILDGRPGEHLGRSLAVGTEWADGSGDPTVLVADLVGPELRLRRICRRHTDPGRRRLHDLGHHRARGAGPGRRLHR
jgi:hypothetical protein